MFFLFNILNTLSNICEIFIQLFEKEYFHKFNSIYPYNIISKNSFKAKKKTMNDHC